MTDTGIFERKGEYKVIIIGALGVGKTSLLLRYVHNTFEDRISKFISEERKPVVVNGKEVVLHLWDTAGKLIVRLSGACIYLILCHRSRTLPVDHQSLLL